MKRFSVVVLAVAMTAFFVTPGFAMLRKDMQSAKGTVTYINSARTEVTIKDSTSGKDVTFSTGAVGADIKMGSAVIVLYKTGTTSAKTVRLLPAKRGGAAVAKVPAAAPTSTYVAPKAVSSDMYGTPKTTTSTKKSNW